MGDVAMSAPAVRALSQKYGSDVKIVMLTPKFHNPFFFGIKNLELYNIELHGKHEGIRGIRALYKELSKKYKFDVVIDIHSKLYSQLLCFFFRLSGTRTVSIDKGRGDKKSLTRYKGKKFEPVRSSIDRYCDTFRLAGFDIEVPNSLPEVNLRPLPEFAQNIIDEFKKSNNLNEVGIVGIAPFAKHKGKTLPLDTIRGVIEQLNELYPNVVIFIFGGGKLERLIADSLVGWYPRVFSAIGQGNLESEMNLMSNLDVMLSMDSSAMHLCSLLGVKVVSVWGATHKYAGFLGLGQSEDDIVELEMDCRPCSVFGNKKCMWGDNRCMQRITAQQVVDKLSKHLNS